MSDLPDLIVSKGCAAVADQCTGNSKISNNNLEGVADGMSLVRFRPDSSKDPESPNISYFEKAKEHLRILGLRAILLQYLNSTGVRLIQSCNYIGLSRAT